MTAPTDVLRVNDLRVHFVAPDATVYAVNGVDLHVKTGETLAVVGESGSGKSATMKALLGLLPESAQVPTGSAVFASTDTSLDLLSDGGRRQLRRLRGDRIGFVAQDPLSSLNPTMRISHQLIDVMRHHLGLSRRAARTRAIDLLDRVGIPEPARRVDSYPHELSGGMRQRVMIAIAISCDPALVIADEPTTALDVTVQAQIVDLLSELQQESGMALVWITHDLAVVAGIAERVAVMYAGRVCEAGTVDEIFARPRHPYTRGLLAASPRPTPERQPLVSIPGTPPDGSAEPTFCAFAPRCAHRLEVCTTALPPLEERTPHGVVACFADLEVSP